MIKKAFVASFLVLLALVFKATFPPSPKICSFSSDPSLTSRIKLKDGRNLVYKEYGVPKKLANYKVVYIHSFGTSKFEAALISSQAIEELGVYFVSFDRPGYGKSDPHPKKTFKTLALDVEELADQLELGTKFYVMGFSLGGQLVWGCLKYIPERLAGAALLAPVINFWWPGFPANLTKQAFDEQLVRDQWAYRVIHYAPWLVYWWNTQKWFPGLSVITGEFKLSQHDLQIASSLDEMQLQEAYVVQQGEFESLHRDLIAGFGKVEFDPMDMKNPFPNDEGSVHLWHGAEDGIVSVKLQRFIVKKLRWINYHELSDAGHIFPYGDDSVKDAIWKTLLTGKI
ncbi:hypothetical protein RND71_025838 [Anisodus tanguticus]|uniref:AB hydrolase-1 domain-containing protein n=1 Tax=Anisodus tanguticus TaxID=243964 RepID=A0AAE1RM39_9SOLA|nr:hypothetical protein RND71_025838 [Anisodus tanguticus]